MLQDLRSTADSGLAGRRPHELRLKGCTVRFDSTPNGFLPCPAMRPCHRLNPGSRPRALSLNVATSVDQPDHLYSRLGWGAWLGGLARGVGSVLRPGTGSADRSVARSEFRLVSPRRRLGDGTHRHDPRRRGRGHRHAVPGHAFGWPGSSHRLSWLHQWRSLGGHRVLRGLGGPVHSPACVVVPEPAVLGLPDNLRHRPVMQGT